MKITKILPLIGIFIFILVITKVGIKEILVTLSAAKVSYLLFALVISFFTVLLQAYKWHMIVKGQNYHIPFIYAIKVQFISLFYGTITPGKLGSFIKVHYLHKKIGRNYGTCLPSVLMERFLDLFVVTLLSLLGAFLVIKDYSNVLLEITTVLIFAFFVIYIFSNKEMTAKVLRFVFNFLVPARFKDKAKELFQGFYEATIHPKHLLVPFILTVITWVTIYMQLYLVALSLNIVVPLYYFVPIMSIVTMIGLIPVTISGLGTREIAMIALFDKYYVVPKTVVAMSLAGLIISLAVILFGAFLAFRDEEYL
ncbi:MAG TPA: lysylphosphatidylglycerol synthase transmembrane domain-containing protein [Candidatus Nanoarchaeia archaeon]|nr:lysylphosphatidylglycerol synthase transmembrane domain-containing protein [Candidatus Nanoarchaeia archaeon]